MDLTGDLRAENLLRAANHIDLSPETVSDLEEMLDSESVWLLHSDGGDPMTLCESFGIKEWASLPAPTGAIVLRENQDVPHIQCIWAIALKLGERPSWGELIGAAILTLDSFLSKIHDEIPAPMWVERYFPESPEGRAFFCCHKAIGVAIGLSAFRGGVDH